MSDGATLQNKGAFIYGGAGGIADGDYPLSGTQHAKNAEVEQSPYLFYYLANVALSVAQIRTET